MHWYQGHQGEQLRLMCVPSNKAFIIIIIITEKEKANIFRQKWANLNTLNHRFGHVNWSWKFVLTFKLGPNWWQRKPTGNRQQNKWSFFTTHARLPTSNQFSNDELGPDLETFELTEYTTYNLLRNLNPRKACGPDGIPNWLLKSFAEILAEPVCHILNNSYDEHRLPSIWKHAGVIPVPK